MNSMKHFNLYISLFVLCFLYSCSSDERLTEDNYKGNEEITEIKAVMPDLDTDDVKSRTSFTTGPYGTVPNPEWIVGDSIGIYPNEGDQLSFRITTSGKTCPFSGGGWAMKASSSYTAYSPFQRSYYFMDKKSLPINMLGQTQKGNDNSAHLSAYDILIAKGDKPSSGSLNFGFSRKVALVRLELTAPCAATWKSVTLESNAAFTTKAVMDLSLAEPTLTPTAQSNSVSLALENVTTTSDNLNIVAYTMLLPVDLTGKSLTVTLKDAGDNIYTTNATVTNNKTNIAANAVRWITAEFTENIAPTIPYVTFTSGAVQSLRMTQDVNSLEYSVNGGEWNTLSTTEVTFGGSHGELRLRGKSAVGTNGATIVFGEASAVACDGDIRTLIDYENYNTVSTENAVFSSLFSGCTSLTKAPTLPATVLKERCYERMFNGCTSLTVAPILSATTLAANCYEEMFAYCTNLATAPTLPAKILTGGCYRRMFNGCTKLAIPPVLPATTLAANCYDEMFCDCTNLTEAPELPATTLAQECYSYMFFNCRNLTKAPTLPATTLAKLCYEDMFRNCISLTKAPELPATTLAELCYHGMFDNCTSLTEAPELPARTLTERCYEEMFYNCTSLTKAPELPATTLAQECYMYMFGFCTGLTEAPELPATALAQRCYFNMFYNCTSLTEAPELSATTLASNCYEDMFRDCSSLSEAPALPATTLEPSCYSGMFNKCTSLTIAPALPATILASSCYSNMFNGCTNLTEAPILPAAILEYDCYRQMFYYCNKLNEVTMLAQPVQNQSLNNYFSQWLYSVGSNGTLTVLPSMKSKASEIGVPNDWTTEEYVEPIE